MYYKYLKFLFTLSYILLPAFIMSCSNQDNLAGSASQTGNGMLTGKIESNSDITKEGVIITLRAHDFNPIYKSQSSTFITRTTLTDENGQYRFDNLPTDTYTVQGSSPVNGHSLLHFDITVKQDDTTRLLPDTLQATGKLRLYLSNSIHKTGEYIYIPGTSFGAVVDSSSINNTFIDIDSIPATRLPGLFYSVDNSFTQPQLLRSNVIVKAGEIVSITFLEWKYSKKIFLNTTVSGANVSGTIVAFPILIRLDANTINFNAAKIHGEDIRFTKPDGTFLPYEIEQWDAESPTAAVWVKVDTVFGNDKSHFIEMYWGNSSVKDSSNSANVFDTAEGFQAVWHLNENDTAKDATENHYNGTPSDTAPAMTAGIIGTCRSFNGFSNYLHIKNTAASKINFGQNDTFSISAWAYVDTLDNASHILIGKGNEQYFMKFKTSTSNNPMVWEFVNFHSNEGWYITNTLPSIQQSKTWIALTGIQKGSVQYLYINGVLVDSSISISPSTLLRTTDNDVTIGRFLSIPSDSIEGLCPFNGKIDEVRISNRTYNADWIKLCYMNQNTQNALVNWDQAR